MEVAVTAVDAFDVVVVGGGPCGATAAHDLARQGHTVMLLDRGGRIKPCGGAIPPQLMRDFAIPETLLKARVGLARMSSPKGVEVDMPIKGGYVGMVDREDFDEWLRERAAAAGAMRCTGRYIHIARGADGVPIVHYLPQEAGAAPRQVRTGIVIGANGALSTVGRQEVPGAHKTKFVFAYHEIVRVPEADVATAAAQRCEIHYRGALSPDFYAWIFPHGDTTWPNSMKAIMESPLGKLSESSRRAVTYENAAKVYGIG